MTVFTDRRLHTCVPRGQPGRCCCDAAPPREKFLGNCAANRCVGVDAWMPGLRAGRDGGLLGGIYRYLLLEGFYFGKGAEGEGTVQTSRRYMDWFDEKLSNGVR